MDGALPHLEYDCQTERMDRSLTHRERAVLDALLAVDFPGVQHLRHEADTAVVVRGCDCGCPSIDLSPQSRGGMAICVNAAADDGISGLFLFTIGGHLGGIEWVGASERDPTEFPDPATLTVSLAEA